MEVTENSRKLASIQIINTIQPINKSYELASVLGWQVIVPKGLYKPGEKIIYIEIDSLLPCHKKWAKSWKKTDYQVKTKMIDNFLSQGAIFPISILEDYYAKKKIPYIEENLSEGKNLSKILNIVKYEDDADLLPDDNNKSNNKKIIKESIYLNFPDELIKRTDEPRIQSNPKYLDIFKGKPYYASVKYDGTSGTFLIYKDEFFVCSRNKRILKGNYSENEDFYWKVAIRYDIYNKLLRTGKRFAIQCEIYGPKICQNLLAVGKASMAIFTIKDIIENKYLDLEEMEEACKMLDLPMVKIIEKGEKFGYSLDEIKNMAKGFYEGTENPREGVVFRLQKNWYTSLEKRYSFKYVNDDYLLFIDKIKD